MIDDKTIYLDFQASTPIKSEVLATMQPYLSEIYGNPHSNDHIKGWEANKSVEKSREQIALAINADSDEIIFTSGATEANNMVIKGLEKYLQDSKKSTILVSSIEHKCVLQSAEFFKGRGFDVIYVRPNSDGIITKEALEDAINDDVGLVSIMLVNNEIGTIQPVRDLAEVAHRYGAAFHTDAAQAPVFIKLDVDELSVDFMSLSSHKIYGPKGVGILYISRDYKGVLQPLIHGGGQEDGLRSGTLPTALCVGMGEAMELCSSQTKSSALMLDDLSQYFWQELKNNIPGVSLNGSKLWRHPGNLNVFFPDIDSAHFLQTLQPNIAASTGSACNSGIESPSYVLAEIGMDRNMAKSCIRFSFGLNQTREQISKAVEIITNKYKQQISLECVA